MNLKDLKDVLTFAAFRPEPDNPKHSWPQRFPKRRSVLINVNRGHCSWAYLNKKGEVDEVGESNGELAEVARDMSNDWKNHTEDGWVGVSINNRLIISLEHNLSRKKGWEDEIRRNPKSLLGTKHDRTKRYALHHSAETSASLLLACDESMIKSLEEALRGAGLKPARVCSGLFAMTAHLMNRIATDETLKNEDLIVVTWCHGSLAVLRQKGGQWQDLRCRSGLPAGDEGAVAQMVNPFVDKAQPSTRVIFMAEEMGSEFATQHLPLFQNLQVTDMTEQHNLWNLMARH